MVHKKLPPRLKMIKEKSKCYPLYQYRVQLEQYLASYEENILDNTPEIIMARLKTFFPEIKSTLTKIENLK